MGSPGGKPASPAQCPGARMHLRCCLIWGPRNITIKHHILKHHILELPKYSIYYKCNVYTITAICNYMHAAFLNVQMLGRTCSCLTLNVACTRACMRMHRYVHVKVCAYVLYMYMHMYKLCISLSLYIYTHIFLSLYIYIYIYTYFSLSLSLSIYIYIHTCSYVKYIYGRMVSYRIVSGRVGSGRVGTEGEKRPDQGINIA